MLVHILSRSELLQWAQQFTNTEISRIQSLSDGVIICNIFNQIFPNSIQFNKINIKAKTNFEKQKNIGLFFDAIFKLQLPPIHINKIQFVDLSVGKAATILDTLKWLYKRYEEKNSKASKGNLNQIPKKIKNYLGELVTRRKSNYQKVQSSHQIHPRSDKRKSQTCEQKNSQKSEPSKFTKSSKPRQSKIQLYQEGKLKQTFFCSNKESIEISSSKKSLNESPVNKFLLSKDKIPKKLSYKKQTNQRTVSQVFDQVIHLDHEIIKSKLIKISTCLSEQKSQTKLQKKLIQEEPSSQQINVKEQKQLSSQSNSSQVFFSIENNTENIEGDTNQTLQLQEDNQNKIQTVCYNNQNIEVSENQNQKQNLVHENNLNNIPGDKNQTNTKSINKASFDKNIEKNQRKCLLIQEKVLKQMSGKKDKKSNKKPYAPKVQQDIIDQLYPDLNPQHEINYPDLQKAGKNIEEKSEERVSDEVFDI